jgi:para-nitrobenzyl esterase
MFAAAHKLYGDRADKFLELYPAHDDAGAKLMGNIAAREALPRRGPESGPSPRAQPARRHFTCTCFSRVHPFVEDPKLFDHPQTIGAYHTSDVPYWFETQDALNLFRTTRNWAPYDRELADKMSDCLVAFATTGNPATRVVAWPEWTNGSERYVEFSDTIGVRAEDVERMQFQSEAGVTATTPRASRD